MISRTESATQMKTRRLNLTSTQFFVSKYLFLTWRWDRQWGEGWQGRSLRRRAPCCEPTVSQWSVKGEVRFFTSMVNNIPCWPPIGHTWMCKQPGGQSETMEAQDPPCSASQSPWRDFWGFTSWSLDDSRLLYCCVLQGLMLELGSTSLVESK